MDQVLGAAELEASYSGEYDDVRAAVLATARRIDRENQEANLQDGPARLPSCCSDGMNVLTHCNAGPAGGRRHRLGARRVIYMAQSQGKRLHVWVDETRPLVAGRAPDHLGAAAVGTCLARSSRTIWRPR